MEIAVSQSQAAPFADNDYCFACGSRNPLGLHLSFLQVGDTLQARVRPLPHWQGWRDVVHGGLQATIMDDLMSNHLFKICRIYAVTADLQTRFRRPVPLGCELLFTSRLTGHKGRVWSLTASCATLLEPAVILTTAEGRFVEVQQP